MTHGRRLASADVLFERLAGPWLVPAALIVSVAMPLALRAGGPSWGVLDWLAFIAEACVHVAVTAVLWRGARRAEGDDRTLLRGAALGSALLTIAIVEFRRQYASPGVPRLPIADACQLAAYATCIVTMLRIQASGRNRLQRRIVQLESLTIGLSVGLIIWHTVVRGRYQYSVFGTTIGPTLELLYPILDALLVVLAFDLLRYRASAGTPGVAFIVLGVGAAALGDTLLTLDAYITSIPAVNAAGDIIGSAAIVGFALLARQVVRDQRLLGASRDAVDRLRGRSDPLVLTAGVLVIGTVATATLSELIGHGQDGVFWVLGLTVLALVRFTRVFFVAEERADRERAVREDLEQQVALRTAELATMTAARTRLVSTLSHELRTPLNAILGLTHLMTVRDDVTPTQRETLTRIQRHGRHLVALSDNVLAMARIEAGTEVLQQVSFDLDTVIQQATEVLTREAGAKGLSVTIECPSDLPRGLVGDPTRLTQLLLNFITNAVKHTSAGGIRMRLAATDRDERIELHGEVQDTGTGITDADQARLFSPFTRLGGEAGDGSGLGLAICRWIAERMDGTVGVWSAPGVGSTFWFRVRLTRQPGIDATTPVAREPMGSRRTRSHRGARILVVDDSAVNREIAREVLTAVGMEVVEADGGRVAVALALSQPFDAVLMDLRMPDMDGYAATQAIRRDDRGRSIPVIAMTAMTAAEDGERSRGVGMSEVLWKPLEPDVLVDTVLRWTGVSERSSASSARRGLPADAAPALSGIIGLDPAAGLRRVMGNRRLYESLLREFVRAHGNSAHEIDGYLRRGDLATARRIAHTLRGVAGGIGATAVHTAATALEHALRDGDQADGAERVRALHAVLDPLAAALHARLGDG